jgi:alanyl-tRNA synthetase
MLIEEKGFKYNRNEFNALLEAQREHARVFFRGGEAFSERVSFIETRNQVGETEFIGNSTLNQKVIVKGIVKEGELVSEARKGEEVALVLDRTPFYAEKGGQVGDEGIIKGENFIFEVHDTQAPIEGLVLHIGKVAEGKVSSQDDALAQVDYERRQAIRRAHTSTHILQAVLRRELGETISQQGSEVKPDEFRFDFNFTQTLERELVLEIEKQVNELILQNLPVTIKEMDVEEAKSSGALAFFGEKYGEIVRVVEVQGVSKELCGGTHVSASSEIGTVVLVSTKAVASGVKRIEAFTGRKAYGFLNEKRKLVKDLAKALNVTEEVLFQKVQEQIKEINNLNKLVLELKLEVAKSQIENISPLFSFKGLPVYAMEFKNLSPDELKKVYDLVKKRVSVGGALLITDFQGKSFILTGKLSEEFPNLDLFEYLKEHFSVKGGGSDRLSQGSAERILTLTEVKKALEV